MIQMLKVFITWLDKRFPAKVVVTLEDYKQINMNIRVMDAAFREVTVELARMTHKNEELHAKMQMLSGEINKFNAMWGLTGSASMKQPGLQR